MATMWRASFPVALQSPSNLDVDVGHLGLHRLQITRKVLG